MFLYGFNQSLFDEINPFCIFTSFTLVMTKQADPNDRRSIFGLEGT